ncbi:DUF1010 domain-containing protein [Comamonas kerstersii]
MKLASGACVASAGSSSFFKNWPLLWPLCNSETP